jgi:hypothetical protein
MAQMPQRGVTLCRHFGLTVWHSIAADRALTRGRLGGLAIDRPPGRAPSSAESATKTTHFVQRSASDGGFCRRLDDRSG